LIHVDEFRIERGGGRLRNSSIDFNARHPIVVPRSHPVTIAMIVHFHKRNLPAGPRALISSVVKKRVLHASESDRVCFNTSWLPYRRRG